MISEKRTSPAGFKTINPGPLTVTDYILMYAKNKEKFVWKPYYVEVDYDENYNLVILNPEDPPEKWEFGNYYPDFVVDTESVIYIIELKAENEIKDEDVIRKAKAACDWCKKVSEFTGQKWEYRLIPHTQVKREDTFEAIIQRSVI